MYGLPRPEVANTYGAQFGPTGFSLSVSGLAPGRYEIVAQARSTLTGTFNGEQRVTVGIDLPRLAADKAALHFGVVLSRGSTGPQGVILSQIGAGTVDWAATANRSWLTVSPASGVAADDTGVRRLRLVELDRLELRLGSVDAGYLVANGTVRDLPPGSMLDPATGQFTWALGAGYIGTYRLAFVRRGEQIVIDITIRPAAGITPAGESEIRMHVDPLRTGATASNAVSSPVTITGWALDPRATFGSGIDAVHVWAQRTDVPGVQAEFLGAATLDMARPDVAQAFGASFTTAGFALTTPAVPAGAYDVTVYAWNRRTARWEDARTVTVTIR